MLDYSNVPSEYYFTVPWNFYAHRLSPPTLVLNCLILQCVEYIIFWILYVLIVYLPLVCILVFARGMFFFMMCL